jgi:hypothetical protein
MIREPFATLSLPRRQILPSPRSIQRCVRWECQRIQKGLFILMRQEQAGHGSILRHEKAGQERADHHSGSVCTITGFSGGEGTVYH